MTDTLPINSIDIGSRVRKDMGDIASLADSIQRHGLLHPVVVKKDRTLIAGHRRLEAVRSLGWEAVPVTMIEVSDLLSAERDENSERKDFTPTEAVAIGKLIEEQHRAKIAEVVSQQRSAAGKASAAKRNGTASGIAEAVTPKLGASDEAAAKAVGMDRGTYYRAKKVVEAAEKDPEQFGDLPAQMDETRSVHGAHGEMVRRRNGTGRHVALRKLQYPRPNREMQRAVDSLDGICICLRELPLKQLDPSKLKEWGRSLTKAAATIKRVAKGLSNVKAN